MELGRPLDLSLNSNCNLPLCFFKFDCFGSVLHCKFISLWVANNLGDKILEFLLSTSNFQQVYICDWHCWTGLKQFFIVPVNHLVITFSIWIQFRHFIKTPVLVPKSKTLKVSLVTNDRKLINFDQKEILKPLDESWHWQETWLEISW